MKGKDVGGGEGREGELSLTFSPGVPMSPWGPGIPWKHFFKKREGKHEKAAASAEPGEARSGL